jgi:hypothetical protein
MNQALYAHMNNKRKMKKKKKEKSEVTVFTICRARQLTPISNLTLMPAL